MSARKKRTRRRIGRIIRWVVFTKVVLLAFYLVVFRFFRVGSVSDGVRAFNKQVTNPVMMTLAGRRYWYASVIRHVGRRSGKEYSTPVVAEPVEDGFIIPLPYGEKVDWLHNLQAAGRGEIEAKGETYTIVDPEVMSVEEASPLLPPRLKRTSRLFGIKQFLKVKWTSEGDTIGDRRSARSPKTGNLSP